MSLYVFQSCVDIKYTILFKYIECRIVNIDISNCIVRLKYVCNKAELATLISIDLYYTFIYFYSNKFLLGSYCSSFRNFPILCKSCGLWLLMLAVH